MLNQLHWFGFQAQEKEDLGGCHNMMCDVHAFHICHEVPDAVSKKSHSTLGIKGPSRRKGAKLGRRTDDKRRRNDSQYARSV